MLLTKEVEVKLWGNTIKYFNNLGYNGKQGDIIVVDVKDLPKGSNAKVEVLCDYCNKEIVSLPYFRYYTRILNNEKITCDACVGLKLQEKCKEKYGVDNVSQLKDVQKKREETFKEHYGTLNPLQSKKIKNKQAQTIFNVYGVNNISQLEDIKKKKARTTYKHYGVDCPSKSEKVKEKTRITNIQRYGVPYTQQSPEVRAKANETLCKNGNQKTSKQQLYLHSLYGGELNYFAKYYAIDICFPEEKFAVEYDGGGHDLRVTLGRLTQEEFKRKEIIRNNTIKREGYKQMRIISENDKLPSDTILLQMLSEARTYFQAYPSHSWIEFNLDTSTVRNAENINGIPYDFGALRTIKDNDIQSDIETQKIIRKGREAK